MRLCVRHIILTLTAILLVACVDHYNPYVVRQDYNYLVVDGFINSNQDSSFIKLSRTKTLDGVTESTTEKKAVIKIEEYGGVSHTLMNRGDGSYVTPGFPVSADKKYRMRIMAGENEYLSDYESPLVTPAIDSVSWKVDYHGPVGGVQMYVSTHDDIKNSRFFYWTYNETWLYSSKYPSSWVNLGDTIVERHNDIYYCYSHRTSSSIFIGTSAPLSENIVSEFPINFVELTSPTLSRRYSINVQQYALTQEGYAYFLAMKKNTEELGSLFGPLPYQGQSNITCQNDPDQPVIGYFTMTSRQEKRRFISQREVPPPSHYKDGFEFCRFHFVPLDSALEPTTNLIVDGVWDFNVLQGFLESPAYCVDCRLTGGTLVKPDYW